MSDSLPDWATKHDPRLGVDEDGAGDWLRRWQSCSICSLLNRIEVWFSVVASLSWFDWVWHPRPSVCLWGTQFVGLPWIFQHMSQVCPWRLQWSHRICSPCCGVLESLLFLADCEVFLVAKAELSVGGALGDPSSSSMTFRRFSSLQTSAKASSVVGNGRWLKMRPLTSSRSRFNQVRKSYTHYFSRICLCFTLQVAHTESSSRKRSSSC